jgi:hypothetical protein
LLGGVKGNKKANRDAVPGFFSIIHPLRKTANEMSRNPPSLLGGVKGNKKANRDAVPGFFSSIMQD